jgi:predicted Zn-dependent protease
LIAMTASRDELASVLAHELSHITQRHIARSIAPSRQASILGIVTTILGVLAASRSRGPDGANAANAMIAGGQAVAIQSQLNFSRDMEREADRVGYGVMTQAGYSATGMAEMFEKLDQSSRFNDSGNYPYLRSHPLTVDRIGEARSRAGLGAAPTPAVHPLEHATAQARARVLMDPRTDALRRLEGPDANPAPASGGGTERPRDSQGVQLPDVLVESAGAGVAERLGAAYASALAATLLLDWARADAALAQAFSLVQGSPRRDDRALRAVQLLAAQSMLERGDTVRAAAAMAPLRSDASRPVLMLQAQIALAAYARAFAPANPLAAEQGPLAVPALKRSAESLQTWVATHPQDALAWKTLSQVWARLGQPLRALRADAEAQLVNGDLPGAIERLRAAQRLARSGGATDFIEASVVDARLRAIEAERRALMGADGKKKGGGKDDGEPLL